MNRTIRNIFIACIISASIVVSAVFAAPAAALSVGELQTQIQELLTKVTVLQEQLRLALLNQGGTTDGEVSDISVTAVPRLCKLIPEHALALGTRGDEVMGLQEFLRAEGYFGADTTGFFGPITRDALVKWQVSESLQGAGVVGPLTRERIKMRCSDGVPGQQFTATPVRGSVPLTVTFNTWLSGFRVQNISYSIDFGDGSSERAADCNAPADACISPGQNTHTYTSAGTYTATLNKITDPCAGNPMCKAAIHTEVVGKIRIQVGEVGCTKEYRPVCGSKPVVCITTPCNPVQQTYGNRCMLEADGASPLYEGVCRDDSGGNRAPSISSLSGPTVLSVQQSGTWTIQASDPENQQLTYSITWGDEFYGPNSGSGTVSAREVIEQTTTFTHSYTRAGTYTVVVVVRDLYGKEAKATVTVKVGSEMTACTLEYAPVCGRPTGCANTCPPGMYCAAICRLHDPVTYGNKCQMNATGAEYLYEGQCRTQ